MTPLLQNEAEFTAANELRLKGVFSAQSLQLHYNLAFMWLGNEWHIETLVMDTIATRPI